MMNSTLEGSYIKPMMFNAVIFNRCEFRYYFCIFYTYVDIVKLKEHEQLSQ